MPTEENKYGTEDILEIFSNLVNSGQIENMPPRIQELAQQLLDNGDIFIDD